MKDACAMPQPWFIETMQGFPLNGNRAARAFRMDMWWWVESLSHFNMACMMVQMFKQHEKELRNIVETFTLVKENVVKDA